MHNATNLTMKSLQRGLPEYAIARPRGGTTHGGWYATIPRTVPVSCQMQVIFGVLESHQSMRKALSMDILILRN